MAFEFWNISTLLQAAIHIINKNNVNALVHWRCKAIEIVEYKDLQLLVWSINEPSFEISIKMISELWRDDRQAVNLMMKRQRFESSLQLILLFTLPKLISAIGTDALNITNFKKEVH